MAEAFHIVSVERSLTNWGHRHITAVHTAPKPGFLNDWPIASVLAALVADDLFFTITPMGDPAFARPYRCMCGFQTIRTTPSDLTEDGFERISTDHGEQGPFSQVAH
jgi:hypothetical protein